MRFSIVTPAYNAEKHLKEMLESTRRQSFTDWELRIVDDGSCDNTKGIILKAAEEDPRIKPLILENNSGSCFYPRRRAIEESKGEYVVNIDADDTVERDYLLKLHKRIETSGADLIYADIYIGGKSLIPLEEEYYRHIYKGKNIFHRSLDKWEVSGVTATARPLALKSLELYDAEFGLKKLYGTFANEVLTRLDLFLAERVAFSDAMYFYRETPDSITHSCNLRRLDLVGADRNLADFVGKHFGKESEEYRKTERQLFHHVIEMMRFIHNNHLEDKDGRLKDAYMAIDLNCIRKIVSPRYWWVMRLGYKPAKLILGIYGGRKR